MNTNDNFDELWSAFRTQVQEARGDNRNIIYTAGEFPGFAKHGGMVKVSDVMGDEKVEPFVMLCAGKSKTEDMHLIECNEADLVRLAAQCLAAVEDLKEAKSNTKAA